MKDLYGPTPWRDAAKVVWEVVQALIGWVLGVSVLYFFMEWLVS